MCLPSAGRWLARLLFSGLIAAAFIAAMAGIGQYLAILHVFLLIPGAAIAILLLSIADDLGLSGALIAYLDEDGPVVYLIASVFCMFLFWWLVAFGVLTNGMARRRKRSDDGQAA